jgi:formylglycine-generating enzyme
MRRTSLAFCAVAILFLSSPASGTTIDTVPVGDAGNAADQVYAGGSSINPNSLQFGAVAYNYRIGRTEVTVQQYTDFLNSVAATDTYGLYNPSMATDTDGIRQSGASGSYSYSVIRLPNRPITYVSWADAARFANWLHNGQPSGLQTASTTERGAYTLDGAMTQAALSGVSRNADATWFLPSENEWYKAAYYQPAEQGGDVVNSYWLYPTRTNSAPYSDNPPGSDAPTQSNAANFWSDDHLANGYNDGYAATGSPVQVLPQNYYKTDVGAYTQSSSFYGTFDQGGNVDEWTEAKFSTNRVVRGGSWDETVGRLQASSRDSANPVGASSFYGFRVATVPEPSSFALGFVGACGAYLYARRRRH